MTIALLVIAYILLSYLINWPLTIYYIWIEQKEFYYISNKNHQIRWWLFSPVSFPINLFLCFALTIFSGIITDFLYDLFNKIPIDWIRPLFTKDKE